MMANLTLNSERQSLTSLEAELCQTSHLLLTYPDQHKPELWHQIQLIEASVSQKRDSIQHLEEEVKSIQFQQLPPLTDPLLPLSIESSDPHHSAPTDTPPLHPTTTLPNIPDHPQMTNILNKCPASPFPSDIQEPPTARIWLNDPMVVDKQ
ncbi:hypothetical protein AMATHDRAFT_8637 [Amanita thiersii Skay4041]|uniref:Uncharacterized protein n=1 Tax=Amanita thiersii Skay4041 TaxID=703135 RepID=A0A2A9N6Q1_9AGAR|nr:hypothetical protein AMATHDRAFT_8637 [Amanita thiersii Skay4041]